MNIAVVAVQEANFCAGSSQSDYRHGKTVGTATQLGPVRFSPADPGTFTPVAYTQQEYDGIFPEPGSSPSEWILIRCEPE